MSFGIHFVLLPRRDPAGAAGAGGTAAGGTTVTAATAGGAAAETAMAGAVAGGGALTEVAAAGAVTGLLQHERRQRKQLNNKWTREQRRNMASVTTAELKLQE